MSAFDLGVRYVRVGEQLLTPTTSYAVHLVLDDPFQLPRPDPLALHKVDVCIEMAGQKLEFTYEELAVKLGLKPH